MQIICGRLSLPNTTVSLPQKGVGNVKYIRSIWEKAITDTTVAKIKMHLTLTHLTCYKRVNTLVTFSFLTVCQEVFSHCLHGAIKPREIHGEGKETEGKKKRIYLVLCCRSKTWQSHDQRHLIILELHCSFNPSARTIFYWVGGLISGWQKELEKAVTSCWKHSLLNVACHLWGIRGKTTG